jgi:hypothetical protein
MYLDVFNHIVTFERIFVYNGLVTKSLTAVCTFEEVRGNKMSKDECESFYNRIESSHLVFRGQHTLKLLYSITILNTISLPCKARPIKGPLLY